MGGGLCSPACHWLGADLGLIVGYMCGISLFIDVPILEPKALL